MSKVLKWTLIVLATLAGVLGLLVVAVLLLFDPNDYKDEIAAAVERKTGRELVIEGDIGLTFYPWLGLELGPTRLSDAPGFGAEPFLELERARLAVQLMPLLQRRVVLDTIEVEGLDVRLVRNEMGKANWEQLTERLSSDDGQPKEASEDKESPVVLESLGGVELRRATLVYEDRAAHQRFQLQPLNLELAELDLTRPVPVKADWVLTGQDLPELAGAVSAQVLFQQQTRQLAVNELVLRLTARGEQIPKGELTADLSARLEGDLDSGQYKLPAFKLQALGLAVDGNAEVRLEEAGPRLNARIQVPAFSPRELMGRLGVDAPQTADPKVLASAALQTGLSYAGNILTIGDLSLKLDDSSITGQATVRSFSPVGANFALVLDQLNLDRYLPPETAAKPGAKPGGAPGGGEAPADLPMETLRSLDLNGSLQVGRLVLKGMTIQDLKAQLVAKGGTIRLEPVTAALYQGRYQGGVVLNARGAQPQVQLNQTLTSVQAGPLLKDLIDNDKILGTANLTFTGDMRGGGAGGWLRSLNGQGEVKVTDGAIKGINIAQSIREAQARLTQPSLSREAQAEAQQTDFSSLGGTLAIRNGVVDNRDFALMSPLMRVTGAGRFDLAELSADYLLTVNLVNTLAGQGGLQLADLSRVPIPLRISGPVSDLQVRVDLAEAFRQHQGVTLREKAEEELRKRLLKEDEEQPAEEGAEPAKPQKPEDVGKQLLRELLKGR